MLNDAVAGEKLVYRCTERSKLTALLSHWESSLANWVLREQPNELLVV